MMWLIADVITQLAKLHVTCIKWRDNLVGLHHVMPPITTVNLIDSNKNLDGGNKLAGIVHQIRIIQYQCR